MARHICIYMGFLTEAHKQQIRDTAEPLGFTPHFFDVEQFDEARDCLQNCEILYSHTPDMLQAAPSTLQWFCCSNAGVDPYCSADGEKLFANPDCILTNSNVYGVTIAEHIIMVTLMLLRRMPDYEEIVRNRDWQNLLPIRSIRDNQFTILGTGNIGNCTARNLKGLGAREVLGVNHSGKVRAENDFDAVFPLSKLDSLLPRTKILILALPSTPETVGILSRERIAMLSEDSIVINVGRGSAVDQDTLIEALENNRIAGAALDVVTPEPLPRENPLWSLKNCILTPHVSGNMTLGYTRDRNVDSFCRDLENYAAGKPLVQYVDRKRGY